MRCDLCGGAATVTVENDMVRDKRTRRKHYYNVMNLCDECRRKLDNVRWDQLGGVAREALIP